MKLLDVNVDEAGYSEENKIIYDIKFSVGHGELVGLIGPNGAGKSTTIKSIIGLLPYVKGYASIKDGSGSYSYIPEQPILYEGLTLWEHIEIALSSYEYYSTEKIKRSEELLSQFRLEKLMHSYPSSFSKGMQQKVMLILSFLLEPDVYIVDEPFIGLDPIAIKDLLDLIQMERARGAGILMSTHVLDTAERICNRFILLNNGQIAASGTLIQIQELCKLPNGTLYGCFHKMIKG